MKLSVIIRSSLTTLRMNGRRTFLTMFGIIIGIASVITIISLGNGFQQETMDTLAKDDKGRQSQVFDYYVQDYDVDFEKIRPYSADNIDYITKLAGVDEAKPTSEEQDTVYTDLIYKPGDEPAFGEIKLTDDTVHHMIAGRNLNKADAMSGNQYALIEEPLAYEQFESPEAALGQSLAIEEQFYTIIGVFESPEPTAMDEFMGNVGFSTGLINIPRSAYLKRQQENVSFQLTVYYEPEADMKATSREIKRYLNDEGAAKDEGNYDYFDMSEMMEEIGNTLNMVTLFISAVAGISLFIAGVGVMNMMYISVAERTKEIGIRRSMGATQQSIQWQFLLEGIAITTFGGIVGYILGIIISQVVSQFLPFTALIDVKTALASVMISAAIGIIFSVFPSRQAAKKNVVDILR